MINSITFITNNVDGGIASFIKYLAKNKPQGTKLNIIATTDKTKSAKVRINPKELSKNIDYTAFYYHPLDKRSHILKKLNRLIEKDSILVANDWLELEMASYLQIANPLIYILHGDYSYYYNLAIQHQDIIDSFITINQGMSAKLKSLLPGQVTKIQHQYPPVLDVTKKTSFNLMDNLKIIYAGWINDAKGVFYFPLIDKKLKQSGIRVQWNIFGIGEIDVLKNRWPDSVNVNFHTRINNNKLLQEYCNNDIVILPSHAESLGLTIVEGMKAKLVPIITKLETGACEFISNNINGFLIEKGNINQIVEIIISLHNNRKKLIEVGKNASQTASNLFDEELNSSAYYRIIYDVKKSITKPLNPYKFMNRLDDSLFPNFIIRALRIIRQYATK